MTAMFLKIVNMSISASWLVMAVLVLRLLLKKAPKWANVLLWGIVALRLMFPFSIESVFSLIPSAETIPPQIMADHYPQISTGIQDLNDVVNPILSEAFAPDVGDSANPLQILIPAASVIWLLGIAALLIYTAVSYWTLRRRVDTAVLLRDNIFQSEYVDSPFVLGVLKPRIYLPYTLVEDALNHVVAHEQAHIRRHDHWWKPLGFLLLTLHWFNPLMWLAYILLCRDIEMACDEKVIQELGSEERADYTQALVACSVSRRRIAACPLAFGEVGVKARVKSVLNYRKPAFWLILVAIAACAVAAVCFLTDPVQEQVGISYYYGTVTDQAMSVVNEGDTEGRAYISFCSDDGEEMLIWAAKSCTIPDDLMGKHVMVCTKKEKGTGLLVTTNVVVTDNLWATTQEEAIQNALLDQYAWSRREEDWLQCADFVLLSSEMGGPAATNEIETVTYYGIALHQVFALENGELVEKDGSHVPTALTFLLDDQGLYTLNEYWEPRDGVYSASDIKEKFPAFVWPDTQEYIQRQEQNNYAKAVEHFRLDTTTIVKNLLEKSLTEDEVAYQELLRYGQYTLRYCFIQFEKGGQTGEWARIMSRACKEILKIWGESVPGEELSGQAWYDCYADHAESVLAKNNMEKLRSEKPSVLVYAEQKAPALVPGTTYVPYQCISMNLASSFYPFGGDSGYRYLIRDGYFAEVPRSSAATLTPDDETYGPTIPVSQWKWQAFPYSDEEWNQLWLLSPSIPDITRQYGKILYQPLNQEKFLLWVDGDIWLVKLSQDGQGRTYIWSIYSLAPESAMGTAQWEFAPLLSSRAPVFTFELDLPYTEITAICSQGVLTEFNYGNASDTSLTIPAGKAIHWAPVRDGMTVSGDTTIRFTVHDGEDTPYHGTLYISSDGTGEQGWQLYTASLVGTGLHLSQNPEGEGGILSLVEGASEVSQAG